MFSIDRINFQIAGRGRGASGPYDLVEVSLISSKKGESVLVYMGIEEILKFVEQYAVVLNIGMAGYEILKDYRSVKALVALRRSNLIRFEPGTKLPKELL